jgi:N12 class adenine-specific DNA methylase
MKLPMTVEWQKEFIEKEIRNLALAKAAAKGDSGTVKDIEKLIGKAEEKIKKLDNSDKKDSQIVPFEELGVDQLFIDEAHNFKGLPVVSTQARKTKGLVQGDSQRALDMEMKTQYVQSLHGGNRGVVFATGTPLANAPVVEAYVMLRYLAPHALEECMINSFDDFVTAFGRIETQTEFKNDGKTFEEVQRVTAFVNVPEMMKLFKSVVDIVNSDQIKVPRPELKLEAVPVQMSEAQEKIMEMFPQYVCAKHKERTLSIK